MFQKYENIDHKLSLLEFIFSVKLSVERLEMESVMYIFLNTV